MAAGQSWTISYRTVSSSLPSNAGFVSGPGGECRLARRPSRSRKAGGRAARVIPVWSPPDPYEPTSELYRLMPPRRQADDDDPIVLISPDLGWWCDLAARARPASRRAAGWALGLFSAALAAVIGSLIYGWLTGH